MSPEDERMRVGVPGAAPQADPAGAPTDVPVPARAGTEMPATPAASATPADAPRIAAPSEDVATAQTVALPGEHRGGFRRELTEPVPVTASVHTDSGWTPAPGPDAVVALPWSAAWALAFGVVGLIVAIFVGWGFPLGLVGVVLAIVALRRPWESRQTAVWALCLSVASLVYSAGWLWWASTQGPLFG